MVVVDDDELGGVATVGVFVFVVVFVFSFSLTTVEAGFTTVVLFSVFAGAGEVAGATTSVFCSQAPRSAALARMQISFFIVLDWLPILGLSLNRTEISFRPCRS